MSEINFDALSEALKTFKEAIDSRPISQLQKDGTVHRFKYCFELCWKSIRKLLIEMGRESVSASPKPLFREAHIEGIIDNLSVWFSYIDARNRTSHTYNKKTADEVFESIQGFAADATDLLRRLNERLKEC